MTIDAKVLVLVGVSLSVPSLAKNYAFVIGGGSTIADPMVRVSHEFATPVFKTAAGLAARGWETTAFFSPDQSKGGFEETDAIATLSQHGVHMKPSSSDSVLGTLRELKKRLGPQDKVFLSVSTHGGPGKDGGAGFMVVDPKTGWAELISDADLFQAIEEMRATGAQIAVQLASCHSGDFRPELAEKLRENGEGKSGVCVITSSLRGVNSEGCAGSDFGKNGEYLLPDTKSATAAEGFIQTWLVESAPSAIKSPFGEQQNACWAHEQKHFDRCLKIAAASGIRLTRESSLKDVMRAGRLCDETINFFDSTGKQSDFNAILKELTETAQYFVYFPPNPGGAHDLPRVNPLGTRMRARAADRLARAIDEAADSLSTPYAKAVYQAAHPLLGSYRENLVAQKQKLGEYQTLLDSAWDREAIRQTLGDWVPEIEKRWEEWFPVGKNKGRPSSGTGETPDDDPFDTIDGRKATPPLTVANVRRAYLIWDLQRRYLSTKEAPDRKARLKTAIEELNGGNRGREILRDLIGLQGTQHKIFLDILKKEREAYERTLGQEKDTCSSFTFE